jgi:undecaprenyl-diphosphatase
MGAGETELQQIPTPELSSRDVILLGGLHGITELLPVSSTAHTSIAAGLLKLPYSELSGDQKKSFNVALHTGTAVALIFHARGRKASLAYALATVVPPGLIGLIFERDIESSFESPSALAAGLTAGSFITLFSDKFFSSARRRKASSATMFDGLIVGAAQATALIPGVSRQGAAFAAARIRRFTRRDSQALADEAAIPVLAAASAFKVWRLARSGIPVHLRKAFFTGAVAAFASTFAAEPLLSAERRSKTTRFWAVYRILLAAGVVAAHRREVSLRRLAQARIRRQRTPDTEQRQPPPVA